MSANLDFHLNHPQSTVYPWIKPGQTVVTPWGRGTGKALALDTPLPTATGWTTMGEVQPGDRLLDERGNPCRVTAATEVMHDRECFLVRFDDGTEIVADAEHSWWTWDHRARKSHGRAGPGRNPGVHPKVRTTRELLATLWHNDHEHNHSIPVCRALDLPAADLPVDPYVLGLWLGDGNTNSTVLTVGREDFEATRANLVASRCEVGDPWPSAKGAAHVSLGKLAGGRGRRNLLKDALAAVGVLGNKHIPAAYLRASHEQRQRLLAGLLDSDGHCDKRGLVEFTSTCEPLADGAHELALSLGFKATLNVGRATLYGKDCGPKYRIFFTPHEPVFGLTRKNTRIHNDRGQRQRTTMRYIVSVDAIPSVPVRCIEVDSPSHLFLAGRSMVPTHNSWFQRLVAYLLIAKYDGRRKYGDGRSGVRITWLMDTLKHWKKVHSDLLDAELNGPWKRLGGKIDHVDWTVRFPGGSIMQVFPAVEFRAQAGRGHRTDVVLPDEIDDIEISVFNSVAGPWFSEPWSLKMRLGGGTPRRGRYGLLYHLHQLGLDVDDPLLANFHSHHATYEDCPETVDRGVVEEARRTWHPAAFKREWECSFDSAEGLVYSLFDAEFHIRRPPKGTVFSAVLMGVDWGFSNPGVFLVVGVTGHGDDAQAWLIEEHYETEKVIGEWTEVAEKIRGRYPNAKWYADPSQPSSIKTIRTDAHVNMVGADNRIPQGVACVADKLFVRGSENDRWARLYIHPGCTNTIRELGAYKRKQDPLDPESYTDEIVDRDNHAMDALRYLLMGHFGEPPSVRFDSEPGHYS